LSESEGKGRGMIKEGKEGGGYLTSRGGPSSGKTRRRTFGSRLAGVGGRKGED